VKTFCGKRLFPDMRSDSTDTVMTKYIRIVTKLRICFGLYPVLYIAQNFSLNSAVKLIDDADTV